MLDISVKQHEAYIEAFAYHYRHLSVCLRTGPSQLLRLVRVVQLVKLSYCGHFEFERSYVEGP